MNKMKRFAAIALISLAFASCKKESTDTSANTSTSVVGNWTLSKMGTDANGNNVADDSELTPTSSVGVTGSINFKADGTYTSTTTSGTSTANESGTYTYAGNVITTVHGGTTSTTNVHSLTANRMVTKQVSGSTTGWVVFTR